MAELFSDISLAQLVSTLVYCFIGLFFFVLCWFVIGRIMPFSVVKEIEEDQNVSLGIIIGSMMLGLALIISAAIVSPSDAGNGLTGQVQRMTDGSK